VNFTNNQLYLIGAVVFFLFILIIRKSSKKKKANGCTKKTVATVVRLNTCTSTSNNKPSTLYSSVYEYKVDGRVYQKVGKVGKTSPNARIGDTLTLFYNPKNPDDCYVNE